MDFDAATLFPEISAHCASTLRTRLGTFCTEILDRTGQQATLHVKTYEAGGGRNIACDIAGKLGSVRLTLFITGEGEIPGPTDFMKGQVATNDTELEFEARSDHDAFCLLAAIAHRLQFSGTVTSSDRAGPNRSTR